MRLPTEESKLAYFFLMVHTLTDDTKIAFSSRTFTVAEMREIRARLIVDNPSYQITCRPFNEETKEELMGFIRAARKTGLSASVNLVGAGGMRSVQRDDNQVILAARPNNKQKN